MSNQRSYDIEIKITAYQALDAGEVSENELRLLNTFFPEILREMLSQLPHNEE